MEEYLKVGFWFGLVAFILTWFGYMGYAIEQYDLFLGILVGLTIGTIFSIILAYIAAYVWPLFVILLILLMMELSP